MKNFDHTITFISEKQLLEPMQSLINWVILGSANLRR